MAFNFDKNTFGRWIGRKANEMVHNATGMDVMGSTNEVGAQIPVC
jgi:hypothetical protein